MQTPGLARWRVGYVQGMRLIMGLLLLYMCGLTHLRAVDCEHAMQTDLGIVPVKHMMREQVGHVQAWGASRGCCCCCTKEVAL